MPVKSPQLSGTVRVTIPVSVAYDLAKFKKSVASLAGKLGCGSCFSGANCLFQTERDYLVDAKKLAVQAHFGSRVATVPDTAPAVTLNLPGAVSGNLVLLNRAIGNMVGKLGCMACTSGFDIIFKSEFEKLKPQAFSASANGSVG